MDLEFRLTLGFNVARGQPRVLQLSQMMFYGSVRVCRNISEQSRALCRKCFVVGRACRVRSKRHLQF